METWRPIRGYPNYEVSSEGNVKSLNYNRSGEERILMPQKNKKGYHHVVLCHEGIGKTITVYKLVAEAFLPNTDNLPTIDHINRVKTDDRLCNLRWASYSRQNVNRVIPSNTDQKFIHLKKNGKYIVQIARRNQTVFCKTYDNLEEAIFARDAFLDAENITID